MKSDILCPFAFGRGKNRVSGDPVKIHLQSLAAIHNATNCFLVSEKALHQYLLWNFLLDAMGKGGSERARRFQIKAIMILPLCAFIRRRCSTTYNSTACERFSLLDARFSGSDKN